MSNIKINQVVGGWNLKISRSNAEVVGTPLVYDKAMVCWTCPWGTVVQVIFVITLVRPSALGPSISTINCLIGQKMPFGLF